MTEEPPRRTRPALVEAVLRSDYDAMREAITGGCDLDEYDDLGMTALLFAVYRGDVEAVRLLLEAGADPHRESRQGTTPLWHATEDFGLHEIAELLRRHGAQR
jgi:ankyrin repeat protein